MDVTVLNLVSLLALGQRIVISLDGTIRVLQDGESLQPGDVILESPNESQISIKRFSPEDGSEVELEQDIANIFAALEEGQDPTELGEEFATEAGQNGSSISISATIERNGQETTPGTEFVTTGFEALGMSRTQSLSLLDAFRSFNNEPTFVDNNNSPVGETLSFTTDEDTPVSGSLSASDEDGDSLTFSKGTDPSNGSVVVDENGNWTYTPDENYNGSDSFTVVVDDGQGGTDFQTITITVTGTNDIVSAVVDSDTDANVISESAVNGTEVQITGLATDADATDTVTYSLTDDYNGAFEIDATTGVVTVKDGSKLDYETDTAPTIEITATSTDGTSSQATFTINLTDDTSESGISAVVDSDTDANVISESAVNGTEVQITGLATDADATDTVTYSLTDDYNGAFEIDATTGVVTVKDGSKLDYETDTAPTIEITATSTDGTSSQATFTI
ncbi:Ig-like domain-containing protein, partial [Vibrio toranzoniae]|uniref:Ig-like domain-containing protein n=1 Tax=Vibrio toranzoniae TaxID=1194427 RepID=UPI001929D39A